DYNDFIEELGYGRYPEDLMIPDDESLVTLYASPDELIFPQIRAKRWFNLEVFNKNESTVAFDLKQLLPASFLADNLNGKWTGKWVYLSLGSMGSIDLSLMKRILDALARTNHKYIVSKG